MSVTATRLRALATTAPGLERLCAAELADLGIAVGAVTPRTVPFRASTRDLYRANVWLRTATRVLLRLAKFPARTFGALQDGVAAIEWTPYLPAGWPVRVVVDSRGSRLFHEGAVRERVAAVLHAAAGAVPATTDGPDVQRVRVRVVADRVSVDLDTSGEPLHRRGWRLATAKAPVAPTIAAAVLRAAGWRPDLPLLDPLCGAGTIPIEAALLQAGRPPAVGRGWAFQHWPSFQPGTWASVAGEVRAAATTAPGAPLVGSDRDDGAVAAARGNADRAGVGDRVTFATAALSAAPAALAAATTTPDAREATPPAGWVVTNPPWGDRVRGGRDLRDLYAALGAVVREQLPGWGLAVLTADPALARHTGHELTPRLTTTSGGRRVHLLVATPEG